jgi:hypothetical protein
MRAAMDGNLGLLKGTPSPCPLRRRIHARPPAYLSQFGSSRSQTPSILLCAAVLSLLCVCCVRGVGGFFTRATLPRAPIICYPSPYQ